MYQNPSEEEPPIFVSRSLRADVFYAGHTVALIGRRSRAVGGQDGKIAAGGGWSNKLLGDSIHENLAGYLGRDRDA